MEPEKPISHVHQMKTLFEELCAKNAGDYSCKFLRERSESTSVENSFNDNDAIKIGNFVTKNSEDDILLDNSEYEDDNMDESIYENYIFDITLPPGLPHPIRELISTECDYVYNLQQGLDKYRKAFNFGKVISNNKRNEQILFGNITEICSFHENELLPMFKKNIKNLMKLFNKFEKFIDNDSFYIYVSYVINKKRSAELYEKYHEYLEGLRKLSGDKLGVESFVLKPIQRLTKYPLILKSFSKEIKPNPKNKDLLESCEKLTDKIERLLGFVDQSQCVSEIREYYDMDLLLQLHLLHINDFSVHDYALERTYKSRVFMFDKCIIYTELIEDQIIYRGSFSSRTTISMNQNCFTLIKNNYEKYEFTADEEIINRWGDLIRAMMVATDTWGVRNSQIYSLISSEQEYINYLRKGLRNYGDIFSTKQTPKGLRGKKLTVFGNLEQIADFHEFVLLPILKKNFHDMKKVFDTFSKLIDDGHFYCYVVYNMNTRESFELCQKYEKYFKKCQKEIGDKLGIKSLLIKPVQKLEKYPILLKSVITACFANKDVSIYNEAVKSCGKLSTKIYNFLELTVVAEEINYITDSKLNFRHQGRLRKVDEFLIKQTNISQYIGKVFLFDKSIILTKLIDGRLIYQGFYSLLDVRVSFMEGHKEFLLCIGDRPSELSYLLGQQSVMQSWVEMITAMKKIVDKQKEVYLREKIFKKFKYFETKEFIESL